MAPCCNRRLHCSTNYITAALIRFHCLIREDDRDNMIAVKDISRKSFLKINETQDEERFSYHTQMILCSRMCSFYSENSWICFMVRWENVGRFRTYTCLLERTPTLTPPLVKTANERNNSKTDDKSKRANSRPRTDENRWHQVESHAITPIRHNTCLIMQCFVSRYVPCSSKFIFHQCSVSTVCQGKLNTYCMHGEMILLWGKAKATSLATLPVDHCYTLKEFEKI